MSIYRRMDKVGFIHTIKYYSVATCVNFENATLSERSQTEEAPGV